MLQNRTLFFGDNLKVLREKFATLPAGDPANRLFDLIYLDPPFNSSRNYNVLFKEGEEDSAAQVHAFTDTWRWTAETQEQFEALVNDPAYPQAIADLMVGLEKVIGHNDLLAYLVMMTVRLLELQVVFVLVLHAMLESAIEDGVQESCARMYERAQYVSVN